MQEYIFSENWPAPDDYLLELGRITALFGSLESNVNLAISKLSGYEGTLDWRSSVLTAHSNFRQRVDILATLCDELCKEHSHLCNYQKVVDKIKKVQAKRNKFSHNSVFLNDETGKVETCFLSARGKLKAKTEVVRLSDLRKISAQIHLVILDLHHLITKVRYPPMWER